MITLVCLLCIVVFRYWWCSWLCEYLLLVVLLMYICVAFWLIGWGCALILCVSLYIFVSYLVPLCILLCFVFLLLVVAPRLPMRTLWDLGVGGSDTLFAHIFVKIFQFFMVFVIVCAFFNGFWSLFPWLLVCI